MPLRVLYLDMNSFFASVEQQDRPELRGRPVGVVPMNVDSTGCIAASYEAKKLGVRTGTPVWEAKQHKGMRIVEARPNVYVQVHHQIIKAVETCVPVHAVCSIDELLCRLDSRHTEPPMAQALARRVKQAVWTQVGECLNCSIGLAPNRLLAKLAADDQKPDGLVTITNEQLPQALHRFELNDFAGIGPKMLKRLNFAGVMTTQQLCELSESQMREIWNGVVGQRWWHWLRGHDLPDLPTRRSSVGHSHVLPPKLRSEEGARAVLIRLVHKVAARLRHIKYWAGRMEVCVSFTHREEGWSGSTALGTCQDTLTMIEAFESLWRRKLKGGRPTHVAVTLYELVPDCSATLPLMPAEQRRVNLSQTLDKVNNRFGPDTVYFGGMHGMKKAAPTRIAFTQIPEVAFDPAERGRSSLE